MFASWEQDAQIAAAGLELPQHLRDKPEVWGGGGRMEGGREKLRPLQVWLKSCLLLGQEEGGTALGKMAGSAWPRGQAVGCPPARSEGPFSLAARKAWGRRRGWEEWFFLR